jgi:hypothetical protein
MIRGNIRTCVIALALAGAAISLSVPCEAQAPGPTQEQKDEARGRFDRGISLFNEGDNAGALAEFSRAYDLFPSPIILFNIGLVHAAMNHPVQALDTLDKVLAAPGSMSAERLEKARSTRAEQAARIATLNIIGLPPGAIVEVDNVRVATAPLAAPLRVPSGSRLLAVIAPGFLPFRTEVTVAGGVKLDVPVQLTPMQQTPAHLMIRTQLPGSDVVVDGVVVGKTPLSASLTVAPGSRKIEVRRAGYSSARSELNLSEGATGELALEPVEDPAQLAAEGGTLALDVSEPDSQVNIDGKPRPGYGGGVRLPYGPHRLQVEHSGFLPSDRMVEVDKGRSAVVRVVLVPTPETAARHTSSAHAHRTWGWTSVVAGAVIAGAGGGFLAYNAGKISDAQNAKDAYDRSAVRFSKLECDPAQAESVLVANGCPARQDKVESELKTARNNNVFGYVGVGVGAAVLATGVVVLLTGGDPGKYERKSGETLAVTPLMTPLPGGALMGMTGWF